MKYLLTLIGPEQEGGMEGMTPEQISAMMEPWNEYNRLLLERNAFVAGEGLHPSSSATTIRVSDDGSDKTVTDGPFAETKEQLGGFYLVECAGLDEALELAKQVPVRPGSSVEVRPALDFSELGYEDPYKVAARAG